MLRVAAALAALTTLLAACTDTDAADPPPTTPSTSAVTTPTNSAPTTPTPTGTTPTGTTPPLMPEAAKTHNKTGAKAFVKYFWALVDYSETTGDTQPLKDLADPGCAGCKRGADNVDGIYERGGRIVGGDTSISKQSVEMRYAGPLVIAAVDFTRTMTPQSTEYPDASQNKTDPGGRYREQLELLAADSGWKVTQFRTLT